MSLLSGISSPIVVSVASASGVVVSVMRIPASVATSTNPPWAVCQATPAAPATRDTGTSQSPTR